MAIDPIGGSPELDAPDLDAPDTGAPPSLVPQAPTGFGGPTPEQVPPPGAYQPDTQPDLGFTPPTPDIIGPAPWLWQPEDETVFAQILTRAAPGMSGDEIQGRLDYMTSQFGPDVMEIPTAEFWEEVGKDTAQVIDDKTVNTLLGITSDSEAFALAVHEEYDSTVGAAWAPEYLLSNSTAQKMWHDAGRYDDRELRDELLARVDQDTRDIFDERFGVTNYTGRVGASGALNPKRMDAEAYSAQKGLVTDISDKGSVWLQDGNNLVLRFYDEASIGDDGETRGNPVASVLVRLRPGTEITTTVDAHAAWILAASGVEHVIDPSSDEVPGRQVWVGSMIEGSDNIIAGIERSGDKFGNAVMGETLTAADEAWGTDRRSLTAEGDEADRKALREQYDMVATDEQKTAAAIVAIAGMAAANPDAPARQAIDEAAAVYAGFTPAQLEQLDAESFEQFVTNDRIRREEMSRFGLMLQEDIFDPLSGFIMAWESALQQIAVSGLRVVNELVDPSATEFEDFLTDARTTGVQNAFNAFWQESEDIGTSADFFGIDKESNWYGATNLLFSLAADPLTYGTAGGLSASRAGRRMIVTTAGVEKWLQTPGVVSVARQIVEKNSPAQIGLLSSQGMSPRGIGRLLDIMESTYLGAPNQTAAMREVVNIMRDETLAYGGMMIPASGTAVVSRRGAMGMGSLFAEMSASGVPGTRVWDWAGDMLARASRSRSAPIGERNWLSPFINDALVWYAKDPEQFIKVVRSAVEMDGAARGGTEAMSLLKAQLERARTTLTEISGAATGEVRNVPALQTMLKEWDDVVKTVDDQVASRTTAAGKATEAVAAAPEQIKALEAELAKITNRAGRANRGQGEAAKELREQIAVHQRTLESNPTELLDSLKVQREAALANGRDVQSVLDELSTPYAAARQAALVQERIIGRIQSQMSRVGAGTMDRGMVEEFVQRFYNDVAETIVDKNGKTRIPIMTDSVGNELTHPIWPDLPMRDWSVVTGRTGVRMEQTAAGSLEVIEEAAERLPRNTTGGRALPLAGGENMGDVGVQVVAGHTRLPASIHELIAFNHSSDALWNFWRNPQKVNIDVFGVNVANTGLAIHAGMDWTQSLWSMSVLFNLGTSVRSSLDEIIRFYQMHGLFPDAEGGSLLARMGENRTLKSIIPGSVPGGSRRTYGLRRSSESMAYIRELDSVMPTRDIAWQVVNPADKGMWVHAERWVNGTLMNDPQFKAFARAFVNNTDDASRRAAWREWWDTKGIVLSKKQVLGSGQPITADVAYDVLDQSLDAWLFGLKDGSAATRDVILGSAARGEQITSVPGFKRVEQFWRGLPEVPGEVSTGTGGLGRVPDAGFNMFYGGPQARRGGVFYDHYYDSAMSMYDEAFAGKVIDEEWLLRHGYANDLDHAGRLIAEGELNQVVRDVVADTGMVLHKDLKEAAMRHASTQADNMMYTFGAVSVLGKKMARIYPFGRAQVDYLQWWWKKLTEPTTWRNPATGATGVQPFGGNVRLVDRIAHLMTLEDPNSTERPDTLSAAGMVNALSFLPTAAGQGLVLDMGFGMGNWAGWVYEMPWMPEGGREAMAVVSPGTAAFSDPADSAGEWFGEKLKEALLPSGRGSIMYNINGMRQAAALIFAGAFLNLDPFDPTLPHDQQRELGSMANLAIVAGDAGPFQRDREAYYQSQYLSEFGLDSTPSMDPDSEWMKDMEKINERAMVESIRNDVGEVADVFRILEHPGTDLQQITPILPIVNYVERWYADGHITEGKRDSLLLGYEAATKDGYTDNDRRGFINEAYDALFDIIPDDQLAQYVAENREAAIGLSSWYRVIPHLVPDEYAYGIDRGRIVATGDDGYDLRKAGYADGWLSPRNGTEHAYDAGLSLHRAVRDNMTRIYEEATGIEWAASKQPQLDDDGNQKVDRNGDPVWDYLSDPQTGVLLSSEWWSENREWVESTPYINIPNDWIRNMASGRGTIVSTQAFRDVFSDAKGHYTYKFTLDPTDEVNLRRIGADDRDPSRLMYGVQRAFPNPETKVMSLAYWGQELIDDYAWAVSEMEKQFGFSDPSGWGDGEYIIWRPDDQITDDMTDDQASMVVSREIFRQRFSGAVGLNKVDPRRWQYSESDYNGSKEYDFFGPIGWEPPVLPPLSEIPDGNKPTAPASLVVVEDGDTLKVDVEGHPVFFRLLGINSADKGEDGWGEARDALEDLIEGAETVSFVIFNPETYGSGTSHFTKEDGLIVRRDRPLVWLYVDGVPVYDEGQFTATNVRGVGIGGTVPDYQDMYDRHEWSK